MFDFIVRLLTEEVTRKQQTGGHTVFLWSVKCLPKQGSKKVPSTCPGQVEFFAGQVIFVTRLPDGKAGTTRL